MDGPALNKCKKTLGRRKIEIKKIQKRSNLQVTFTKRRKGLFRKASELAVLCGAEIAILLQSPADKMFTFGHPSVEALFSRMSLSPESEAMASNYSLRFDEGRRKYEDSLKILEMEKRVMAEKEMRGGWWEEPYHGLELNELEEYLSALETLGENVMARADEFHKLMMSSESAAVASSSIQDSGCCVSSLIRKRY